MTQEARDDRLLGVLFLTARTGYRPRRAVRCLATPACEPVRCQQWPPVVRAVEVEAFSPVLRGLRGMEDRSC